MSNDHNKVTEQVQLQAFGSLSGHPFLDFSEGCVSLVIADLDFPDPLQLDSMQKAVAEWLTTLAVELQEAAVRLGSGSAPTDEELDAAWERFEAQCLRDCRMRGIDPIESGRIPYCQQND